MRCAIERRSGVSFTSWSPEPSADGAAAGEGRTGTRAGDGRTVAGDGDFLCSRCFSTSSLVTRPPAPDPWREATSSSDSPCSSASLRTTGERRARSPSADGPAGRRSATAAVFPPAAAAGGASGCRSPAGAASAVSITAIGVPVATVVPSVTSIFASVPPKGEGISTFTLSVMISTNGSKRSTGSPGCLSHLPMVPSYVLSPSWGIVTSVGIDRLPGPYSAASARIASAILCRPMKNHSSSGLAKGIPGTSGPPRRITGASRS